MLNFNGLTLLQVFKFTVELGAFDNKIREMFSPWSTNGVLSPNLAEATNFVH